MAFYIPRRNARYRNKGGAEQNMAGQAKDSGSFPEHWCNPEWTSWVPFNAGRALEIIPDKPGLCRIRLTGQDLMCTPSQRSR